MPEDPFVEAVGEVAVAARAACAAIEAAVEALEVGVRARRSGAPLVGIVDELIAAGGRDARLATADAFHEFERALVEMRSRVVRALVDDDGLSLTDVGLRLQISRQAVARLYREPTRAGPMDEPAV